MIKGFLPINKNDMVQRGWTQCDFVFVTGDAYVDHPSFGPAILSRLLESYGYKVGIIAQPDWKKDDSITLLGEPRLGFLVSSGNMDSMVNHYSVAKKRRQTDAYSPGGKMGLRPDHATVVYCNLIRKQYKNIPIIIGGIEASLRRLAHYDYWSDKLKRSILLDSQADLLSYGMGEHAIIEIAEALSSGLAIRDITFVAGTVFRTGSLESVYDAVELPSFQAIMDSKREFAKSFYTQYTNTDPYSGKRLVERYKDTEFVVQNPPAKPLTQSEMDRVYSLPYMREYHPVYEEAGGIPAIQEVKFSLVSNRGCYGGCNYCALTFHQGRILQTRSHESILAEANQLIWDKDFKGYIHDVGGPTANFRHTACEKQLMKGACVNKQCLFPVPCKSLRIDHSDYLELLRKLRKFPNVKKVFIRSGIRYDYLIKDKDDTFFKELCEHHISGQLKVAPEHISDKVLALMGKPENAVYEEFQKKYKRMNERMGKNQFVVPYLISSHPGSTLTEAIKLAEYLRDLGYMPEQVQDFYPTPSTISTCMYYTGLDPRTMEEVYVPRSPHEKAMQRALIQYRNPKNYQLVVEALTKAGRTDLIGFDKKCLVRPRQLSREKWSDRQSTSDRKPSGSRKPPEARKQDGSQRAEEGRRQKGSRQALDNVNWTEGKKPAESGRYTENRKLTENGMRTESKKPTESGRYTGNRKLTENGMRTESKKPTESGRYTGNRKRIESEMRTESRKPTESGRYTGNRKRIESGMRTESMKPAESGKRTEDRRSPAGGRGRRHK